MPAQTLYLRLKILSPLHIGCGEVYEPTTFVVQHEAKQLICFNPLNFLASLSGEKRRSFARICKEGTVESLQKIYKFIDTHAQGMSGISVEVSENFISHHQKVLNLEANPFKRELNSFLLARTAFNPVDGSIYLPGTSIKGSIRTAVLNWRNRQSHLPLQPNASALEESLLGGTFAADPFSLLKVSDFHPVTPVVRRIVYALDKKKRPNDKEASALYQMVEIIDPGAIFAGTIRVCTPATGSPVTKPLTLQEVQSAMQNFYPGEFIREQKESRAILGKVYPKPEANACLLRVGRHSGAECVTVEGHRKIRIKQGKGDPPKTLDHATTLWFAANQKDADRGLRPFGWVECAAATSEDITKDAAFIRKQQECSREGRRSAREQVAAQILALHEAEQQRAEAVAARQHKKEEAAKYPWKPWLCSLDSVNDWGAICQRILDSKEAEDWRQEEGVAEAVKAVFERVRSKFPKKWTKERDGRCREWLKPTGILWSNPDGPDEPGPEPTQSEQEKRIRAFKDYGAYISAKLDITILTLSEAHALQEQFKKWGCHDKKAKGDKPKHWQSLQKRLRELKEQGT